MKRNMQPTTNTLSSASASSLATLRLYPNTLALGFPCGSELDHVVASYSHDRAYQLIHWKHPEVNFL